MHTRPERDVLFQTSTIYALLEGMYDGNVSYGDLKRYGDTGIGTFHELDGEMIEVNGKFFQIKSDGIAYPVDESMRTPFAMVTFFESDRTLVIGELLDYKGLEKYLDDLLPTRNIFYAIKIDGNFTYVRTRSVPKQSKPYPLLTEVVKDQPVFEFHHLRGTIIGFRLPDYMKGINMPGYHFHFINENRKAGGHLLECQIKNGRVEMDDTAGFYMILPKDDTFYKRDLTGDKQKEVEEVER
jgi:acetolactate decarboxylase